MPRVNRDLRLFSALLACSAGVIIVLSTSPAYAIPAFARQYGTSCQTCHTVFPALTPFGEAFRRNGFRFPGINSEALDQEPTSMGSPAFRSLFPHSVWPSSVPRGVPLSVGISGSAVAHPDANSGGAAADDGAAFTLDGLAAEASIWGGGPIDDQITFFVELSASEEGLEFEHGELHFGDIAGPQHWLNLAVGRRAPTLSSFGMHSSYLVDMRFTSASLTALYGADEGALDVMGGSTGIELNGVIGGFFDYAFGIHSGTSIDVRNTQDAYAQIGFKLGGMRLDGEPGGALPDATHPWGETALTVDFFAQRAQSQASNPDATTADLTLDVRTLAFGGGIRAQWGSLLLDSGALLQIDDHAQADNRGARMFVEWNELSYVALPWLVPAVRFEYISLMPEGGQTVSDYRITPGVAALIRANVKVVLEGWFEGASGAPPAGWAPAMGLADPTSPMTNVGIENEGIALNLDYAF
ncbi:MAG: hypothetical protein GXP55_19810 [Deltaproteobacteria bacterium]|nr:hypothetical protein [Deltaproteobacteria bacterium]